MLGFLRRKKRSKDTKDTEEIIATVKRLAPTFGGINLEDISAPRCFEIEKKLQEVLNNK